jgi:hypothetical protein
MGQQPDQEASALAHRLGENDAMVRRVRDTVFAGDSEYEAFHDDAAELQKSRTVDFLTATEDDPHHPKPVFERLRWGGQFLFVTRQPRRAEALSRLFSRKGFLVERGPAFLREDRRLLGLTLRNRGPKLFYFTARKMHLVPPGTFSDRFTYEVTLEKSAIPGEPYVVTKRVPDLDRVVDRLRQRFVGSDEPSIIARAKKLRETIFPVFLTREAAFLKILNRDLPEGYRDKVPRVLDLEKDGRGMVMQFRLNWMRKAGKPLGQLDFAMQSADLLQKLHEHARIIHLDLRLDNFVITQNGVGFVDYGSAARVGENIAASPFLQHLFTEIMRTSQIQRMLDHLTDTGMVTSELLTRSRRQVDKAIDLFYLAVQIDQPHTNPYIKELVTYESQSFEAMEISKLTQQVLRPADPRRPQYGSARDVMRGLEEIRGKM